MQIIISFGMRNILCYINTSITSSGIPSNTNEVVTANMNDYVHLTQYVIKKSYLIQIPTVVKK